MPRRFWIFIVLGFLCLTLACQTLSPDSVAGLLNNTSEPVFTPTSTTLLTPNPSSTTSPPPHQIPSIQPAQTSSDFTVFVHPEDGLYVGDLISFEVISPPGLDLREHNLTVQIQEQTFGPVSFGPFGIGNRSQATLLWVWDTDSYMPGEYTLLFTINPSGTAWTETIHLQPTAAVPPPEPFASWNTSQTECCVIHYVSGTAAARDLDQIVPIVNEQANRSAQRMGVAFVDPIEVVLLPRVLGHGGFASDEIAISYLDRNYANNDLAQVIHHEMIHILDRRLGGEYLPSIFVEGLAVYQSGGHFKPEPLLSRAKALPAAGLYIPLTHLADQFYTSQHEVGYLQAGALVSYMVDTWGWQAFDTFYRSIPQPSDGLPSTAINQALQNQFDISLAELESQFLLTLEKQSLNPDMREDMLLTVQLYDTIRRYQQALDPSAYFLTAWLLNGPEMRQRGIVADYLRHPDETENQYLETMLVSAGDFLVAGQYSEAQRILIAVNSALDTIDGGSADPLTTSSLLKFYFSPI
jgi:hypothetical protein